MVFSRYARQAAATAFVVAATWYFADKLDAKYPIGRWLFWDLAPIWAWELVGIVAWTSLGRWIVRRVLRIDGRASLEMFVYWFTSGVVGFVVALFALGACGLFRPLVAAALPLGCILISIPSLRRAANALRRGEYALPVLRFTLLETLGNGAGLLCLAVIYIQLLTPWSIGCDAGWFHMSAAEAYVREGRLVAFPADWAKTLPQLTSILDTWAFLVPGLRTETHWLLGLHDEFVLFLVTLLGLVPAVRFLRRRDHGHELSWAFFFLFPGVFVYDCTLSGGADHVQAFFVLPLLLAAFRAIEEKAPNMGALAGIFAGGALLTKAQATYVVVPVGLLLAGNVLGHLSGVAVARARKRSSLVALESSRQSALVVASFAAAACLVFVPHAIKNAVFYGNPVYPFMLKAFRGSHPAQHDASRLFYAHLALVDHPLTWDTIKTAVTTAATAPFAVNAPFPPTGFPMIGALFSLLLPLIVLQRERRLWLAAFVGVFAMVAWAFAFPVARNLQTFLPIVVAITAALVAGVWAEGWVPRVAIVALVSLQGVWEGDQIFYESYGRIAEAITLIRSGAEGKSKERFDAYRDGYRELDRKLPANAVVLLHTTYSQLGINRRTLLDWPGFQGLIDYRPMLNARDVYDAFHEYGVTHIAIDAGAHAHSRQEEVVFDSFVYRYAQSLGKIGAFNVWEMPASAPEAEPAYSVLCLSIADHDDGVYRIRCLGDDDDEPHKHRKPAIRISEAEDISRALPGVDAVLTGKDASLPPSALDELGRDFFVAISYDAYTVQIRKSSQKTAVR